MSAPISPGGLRTVSARMSAATVTVALAAWAASITGVRSRTSPDAPGYCSRTPKAPAKDVSAVTGVTRRSIPRGSARVRSTSRVCGRQSASARNTLPAPPPAARRASVIASAAAEASSSREALATGSAGQVGDHRLEVQQRLQAALRDLWLVRRVRGVPGGVLQHVAADHRGRDRVVVAEADHRHPHGVAAREAAKLGEDFPLGARRRQRGQRRRGPHAVRERGGEEVIERSRSRAWRASPAGLPPTGQCDGPRKRTNRRSRSLPGLDSPSVTDSAPELPVPPVLGA